MKKNIVTIIALAIIAGLIFYGLSLRQPANSQEAVQMAKKYTTQEQKEAYLLTQAERFLKEKRLQETANIAKYVILRINPTSVKAQELLRKTQNAILVQKTSGQTKK